MGLRALARRLAQWASAPAAPTDTGGLGTLAPAGDVPRRPARDRRAGVAVAAHDDQSPYGGGVTLIAPRRPT